MTQGNKENLGKIFRPGALVLIALALVIPFTGCSVGSSIRLAGPRPGVDPSSPSSPDSSGGVSWPGTPRDEESPPGRSAPGDETVSPSASAVVTTAVEAMGTPYRWGGSDANGFDCSGLIRYAYGQHGIELPRTSRDQLLLGASVDLRVSALRLGDILGFALEPGAQASHVGLYIGGGEFIHSSTTGVRISTFRNPYWPDRFVAARRVLR